MNRVVAYSVWFICIAIVTSLLSYFLIVRGGRANLLNMPVMTGAVTSATFGTVWKYNMYYNGTTNLQTVNGDGWETTWDDMDQIVSLGDDASDWNGTGVAHHISLNLINNTAMDPTTMGSLITGNWTLWHTPSGSPSGTNKWNSILSVSGVYYAINTWLLDGGPPFVDLYSQVLRSNDHGATWAPTPPGGIAGPYTSPEFPNSGPVNSPYAFVSYGKDYSGSGPDNSNNYIYATTTGAGFLGLARVSILADLQTAGNWQYWTGGDGLNNANWSSSPSASATISVTTTNPNPPGFNILQYLPRYGKYFVIGFDGIPSTTWYPVICDHPWGPCNQFGSTYSTGSNGWYEPSVVAKSIVNGGQQMVITCAGNPSDVGSPTGRYTLVMIPLTLAP